jgi:hypothetical protein
VRAVGDVRHRSHSRHSRSYRFCQDGRSAVRRRLNTVGALSVLIAAFLLASSSALAASPEAPETNPATAIATTTATVHGVLNPNTTASTGYYFAYNTDGACAEGATSSPGAEATGTKINIATTLTGLEGSSEYTFCAVATHTEAEATEATVGPPLKFTTLASPPPVVSEFAVGVTGSSAFLLAEVNPENQPTTRCVFEYGILTVSENQAPCEQTTLEGSSPQTASLSVTGLLPATMYHYRVVVENATGTAEGNEESFTTALPPENPETTPATDVTVTSATLHGVLNPTAPGEPGTYEFAYRQSATECQGEGERLTPATASTAEEKQKVSAEVTGLRAGVSYTFCLLAHNGVGETAVGSPVTLTRPPSIDDASASNETPTTADVSAKINPDELPTTYSFEYGPSTAYGASIPLPDANIGAGVTDVLVTQHLTGLTEGTTYHYRVIASNSAGTTTGEDHTFVYAGTAPALPDGRAYEMVTPPEKNGALVGVHFIGLQPDISEGGSRIISNSVQCFANSPSCTGLREQEGDPYLFTRTSAGWTTTPLAPPATQLSINASELNSVDAEAGLFSAPTPPSGENDYYTRNARGSLLHIGPLTSPTTGSLGEAPKQEPMATADFSHVLFGDDRIGARWPFDATLGNQTATLLEYIGTENTAPTLVGVSGGPGSHDLISICGTKLGGVEAQFGKKYNPMSADGSVVYFTALPERTGPCPSGSGANEGVEVPVKTLYARIDESHTVLISGRSPQSCTGACLTSAPSDAEFQGASADGSQVFFTSTQQLTNDATEGSLNLYEYDFDRPIGENLVAVSAGDTSGGGPGVVEVTAVAGNGSHVYFTATGVLSAEANSQGQRALAGGKNLYVYEGNPDGAGRTAFIATLPSADESFIDRESGFFEGQGLGLDNVTPDGRFLVFLSHGQLTADDTRATGFTQVYRYDAQTGELTRLSVGEHGYNDNGLSGLGDALIVPAGVAFVNSAGPARGDPTMSHDGSFVFFESPIALTPGAVNDVQVAVGEGPSYAENVYEWHNGDVSLISDGKDLSSIAYVSGLVRPDEGASAVQLLGTDATGANVFFRTASRLSPKDTDTLADYYDARIGGGFPEGSATPACEGDGCRTTNAAPPGFAAPGSVTLSGSGNLTPPVAAKPASKPLTRAQKLRRALEQCRRVKKRRPRLVCEKRARHRYGRSHKRGKR